MRESRPPAHVRAQATTRARGVCEYCFAQERFSPDPFSVEHIVPMGRGGTHALDNLAYACQGCNGRKYTSTDSIDPATGERAILYHPRQHVWVEHFVWSADYTLILGITAIGRATVDKLQLNRAGLVNLRAILAPLKLHPPTSAET